MMTNIKGLELIKALLDRGCKGVNVELNDLKGFAVKGFISVANDIWAIANTEDVREMPLGADSLEALMRRLSGIGWTSFRVTETIRAWVEDDVECNCGNNVRSAGFYPCDEQGNEVVPVEDYWDLTICATCGLIFSNRTFDPIAHTYTLVGIGEFEPLREFKLGNGVGYLKGYFDSGECLIENTKEQISAFIMDSSRERETVITDMMDSPQITTSMGLIYKCHDQAVLPELIEILAPQQMGEVEPIKFVPYVGLGEER